MEKELVYTTEIDLRKFCIDKAIGNVFSANIEKVGTAEEVLTVAEKYYNWITKTNVG